MIEGDRWRRIEEICQAALDRDAAERSSFVAVACGSDEQLQREIEALLAHAERADGFLVSPLAALAANVMDTQSVDRARDRTAVPRAQPADNPKTLLVVDQARFEIGRERARGGLGRIMAAHDRQLDREVAIKELLTDEGDHATRFVREARLTARLEHPGIVPIHEAGRWPDGKPFYAMKMVSGRSLRELIAEKPTLADRLALLPNVIAVAETIAYAHDRRVIHRDIKPANVMVGEFGETLVVDWGLAKDLAAPDPKETPGPSYAAAEGETALGAVLGTPAYMPPEQAAGLVVDERADVYAIGALLFHVLAARPPYEGHQSTDVLKQVLGGPPAPLETHVAGVPIELATIVRKAMARHVDDRYLRAKELVEDIKRFQTGQLVGAHQYTPWQLLRRYVAQHWLLLAASTLVGLAALFGVTTLAVRHLRMSEVIAEKQAADRDMAALASQIDNAPGQVAVASLEARLDVAVRRAQRADGVLESLGLPGMAGPPGDEFDAQLHGVLASLDADSYSIPPSFREQTHRQVARVLANRELLRRQYARKQQLWPIITKELEALGLPEGLAYVAWEESHLDPAAICPCGAAGLWQMAAATARTYGLRVDDHVDERTDPIKASRAAAQFFANRLAEFGDDAALIAMASYTTGEDQIRAMLHDLALEQGGWRRGGRGFWHIYRLRKMTPDQMDYLPRVLAFAIIDRHSATYLTQSTGSATVH